MESVENSLPIYLACILLQNIFLFVNHDSQQSTLKWVNRYERIQTKDCHSGSIMNILWKYIFATRSPVYTNSFPVKICTKLCPVIKLLMNMTSLNVSERQWLNRNDCRKAGQSVACTLLSISRRLHLLPRALPQSIVISQFFPMAWEARLLFWLTPYCGDIVISVLQLSVKKESKLCDFLLVEDTNGRMTDAASSWSSGLPVSNAQISAWTANSKGGANIYSKLFVLRTLSV